MIKILFKNVGQGDSILLEWEANSNKHYGIVDCHLYGYQNPLLGELIRLQITHLDFIILSHLHYDHYSGFADLLEYCSINKIVIDLFLHTFNTELLAILNLRFVSQKVQKNTSNFLENIEKCLEDGTIKDIDSVSYKFEAIKLYGSTQLSFLAPTGKDYWNLAKQRSNYDNKLSGIIPDFNQMSTVILVSNSVESVLLTSDATRRCFRRIKDVVKSKITLVQIPHHGSVFNLYRNFWKSIYKTNSCPSVLSVGDVKKDKLPNKEVVEFFDKEGYHNYSTNYVYGLPEYYSAISPITSGAQITSLSLSYFSKRRPTPSNAPINNRFSGDQQFNIPI